jgi:DNA gyrase subunit A
LTLDAAARAGTVCPVSIRRAADDAPAERPIAKNLYEATVDAEMKASFLAYSLSVITARAIPDVRDGFKPVQRRIIAGMLAERVLPGTGYKKSAKVVGAVMGSYHPHGDAAIYEALVRMSQPFVMSVPMTDGHGNFGTLDDPPAAARYTECRMTQAALDMIAEIDEETVDLRPTYDGENLEPSVLPAKLPNLLLNGASGIAVGMATNIPTHNLNELIAAVRTVATNPDVTVDDVLAVMPGPDFPTGGIIVDDGGIRQAYETGRGAFKIRAKTEIREVSPRRRGIVITELPYNVGTERFMEKIKELVLNKRVEGIADVKDLTDRRSGLQIVVECKTGINPNAVLAELYAKTPLQESFSVNAVALVDGKPLTLGVVPILRAFVDHRLEVILRRTRFRHRKATERAHILQGLIVAISNIDAVVAVIRSSADTETARQALCARFDLDETQAGHVLEMPLRRLTSLELSKLESELAELRAVIAELSSVLESEERRQRIMLDELDEIASAYGRPRRSPIVSAAAAAVPADVPVEVPDTPCVVTVTLDGVIGRSEVDARRKGRVTVRDALVLEATTTTRSVLKVVTDSGVLHRLEVVVVPSAAEKTRGAPAAELVTGLTGDDRVVGLVSPQQLAAGEIVVLVTRNGVVKRVTGDHLEPRGSASIIGLGDGDRVVAAFACPDGADIVIVTSDGRLLRTPTDRIRPQGRSGGGVAGVRLADGAHVVAAGPVTGDAQVVVVTDAGSAKSTPAGDYPEKGRGGAGVMCVRFRKGESALSSAVVGAGPFALAGPTSAEAFEPVAAKRDGSASPADATGRRVALLRR